MSLYPYCCKYKPYPKFHPVVIRYNFNFQIHAYFGVIKCKVLPPTNLFHPVLPVKIKNKLFFTLCYLCAKNSNASKCNHSDDDRSITACWGTPELYVALENGYTLLEIYQVWHYDSKFEYIDENNTGLFGSYINKWLSE